MWIKIVGLPSPKSQQALLNAQAAASMFDERPKVRWYNDIHVMIKLGMMHTPTVIVNGRVMSAGRVPSVYEMECWIDDQLKSALVETEEIAA